ncbi:hypothetical protein EVAR_52927_1 [Eumeta japonica]|uniref:Uncharacterized protein n=1 Tax=Eumeta variegata TaxID=151549 RepID=A0A4C1Y5L5_EUMVA|nr:hypothetical protein EVAR_52927_1 [Eumeta japonica]
MRRRHHLSIILPTPQEIGSPRRLWKKSELRAYAGVKKSPLHRSDARERSADAGAAPLSSADVNCDRTGPGACLISRLNKSECYTAGSNPRSDISIWPIHKIPEARRKQLLCLTES